MTADKPQPVTTGIIRLRSTRRKTARSFFVANKRKHELTTHMKAPTARCHYLPAPKYNTLTPSPSLGRDISVGIAACYGLDGLLFESRWGREFPHLSRPALGPTQPPV